MAADDAMSDLRDPECDYPGCTNRLFLEGHHVQHWADGGETSLRNTTLLCSFHHRFVHEYGYAIELGPDQQPRFRDPHGRWVTAAPELPRVAEPGWPQIRAANEALQIDAGTIAGPWDGTPVDYGRVVGHLATADGLACTARLIDAGHNVQVAVQGIYTYPR